jgi:hypothetical protein
VIDAHKANAGSCDGEHTLSTWGYFLLRHDSGEHRRMSRYPVALAVAGLLACAAPAHAQDPGARIINPDGTITVPYQVALAQRTLEDDNAQVRAAVVTLTVRKTKAGA